MRKHPYISTLIFCCALALLYGYFFTVEKMELPAQLAGVATGSASKEEIKNRFELEQAKKSTKVISSTTGSLDIGTSELEQNDRILPLENQVYAELKTAAEQYGHTFLSQFVATVNQIEPELAVQNDYAAYDLETLWALANTGDGKAQLYLGLNLRQQQPEVAVNLYKEALVNTGYVAVAQHISNYYLEQAEQLEVDMHEIPESERELYKTKQSESLYQFALWRAYATFSGDPFAPDWQLMLNAKEFQDYSAAASVDRIQVDTDAQQLFGSINARRYQRGLALLDNAPKPNLVTLLEQFNSSTNQ